MIEGWMAFVDGENFAIRGKAVAQAAGVPLVSGPYYCPDTFLWAPMSRLEDLGGFADFGPHIAGGPRRSFYYTAVQGDDDKVGRVRSTSRSPRTP